MKQLFWPIRFIFWALSHRHKNDRGHKKWWFGRLTLRIMCIHCGKTFYINERKFRERLRKEIENNKFHVH